MRVIPLVLCLMYSGLFSSVMTGHLRTFYDSDIGLKNRTEASKICRKKNMTLVTIYDDDDVKFVQSLKFQSKGSSPSVWVGLRRRNDSTKQTGDLKCKAFNKTSVVNDSDCSTELSFMCKKNMTFVGEKKNWCFAKQYCQDHSLLDLVGDNDTEEVYDNWMDWIFWVGQSMIDEWEWEDNSCSTYRKWGRNPPTSEDDSASVGSAYSDLFAQLSKQNMLILCSKGESRIVVINKTKTWENALDYCDRHHSGLVQIVTEEDQNSVAQWLNTTKYEGTFWVGLRQSRVFGFWIWENLMVDYSNWENETHPEMPLSHQCGVITTPSNKWSDYNCQLSLPFICEEKIIRFKNKTET